MLHFGGGDSRRGDRGGRTGGALKARDKGLQRGSDGLQFFGVLLNCERVFLDQLFNGHHFLDKEGPSAAVIGSSEDRYKARLIPTRWRRQSDYRKKLKTLTMRWKNSFE